MAATCAGLGDSQAKPSCESRLLVLGLVLTEASCYLLRGFRNLWSMSHSYGKAALVACTLGGEESLGIAKASQAVLARFMES